MQKIEGERGIALFHAGFGAVKAIFSRALVFAPEFVGRAEAVSFSCSGGSLRIAPPHHLKIFGGNICRLLNRRTDVH